jgi:hypothetical protein
VLAMELAGAGVVGRGVARGGQREQTTGRAGCTTRRTGRADLGQAGKLDRQRHSTRTGLR